MKTANRIPATVAATLLFGRALAFGAPGDENWASGFGPPPAGNGLDETVYAIGIDGVNVYAGGFFTKAGNANVNNIAKWNGSDWSALGGGVDSQVAAIAVNGTNVYVGGSFVMAGGATANAVARWNGVDWSALGSGIGGASDYVNAVAVAPNGDVYAGGSFTNAGTVAANNIARWNGSSWSALNGGVNGVVSSVAVSGSNVYVGGNFTSADGNPATNIASWNGSNWSALGSGVGDAFSSVTAMAVNGNDLYVAGAFTTAGGNSATNIARWNGTAWSSLGSGVGDAGLFEYANAVAISGAGNLYAGGAFTTAGGSSANSIAKWNGSIWTPLGSGVSNDFFANVNAIGIVSNSVYVGGFFITTGTNSASNFGRWNEPPAFNEQITAIARESNNLRVTWTTVATRMYQLQAAPGGAGGSYSTNGFFVITNVVASGSVTNVVDAGGATNSPARYYRVKITP